MSEAITCGSLVWKTRCRKADVRYSTVDYKHADFESPYREDHSMF